MTVLVTGAGGRVGGRLARLLHERGVAVRALVRDRSRPTTLPSGVEIAVGDFADPGSLAGAFDGVDHAFFVCLPEPAPARLIKHDNVIAAARDSHVQHLVYLSFLNASAEANFPQGRWHADTEAKIDAAGVPWTMLRASLYQSSLLTTAGVRSDDTLLAPAGDGRIAPVAWQDIADVAAAVLASPDHVGRCYDVTGPELVDWSGVASALSDAEGSRVTYQDVPAERFRELLAAADRPTSLIDGMLGLFADIRAGRLAVRTDTVAAVAGIVPTSLAQTFSAADAAA